VLAPIVSTDVILGYINFTHTQNSGFDGQVRIKSQTTTSCAQFYTRNSSSDRRYQSDLGAEVDMTHLSFFFRNGHDSLGEQRRFYRPVQQDTPVISTRARRVIRRVGRTLKEVVATRMRPPWLIPASAADCCLKVGELFKLASTILEVNYYIACFRSKNSLVKKNRSTRVQRSGLPSYYLYLIQV
jgi:hypothetical protein